MAMEQALKKVVKMDEAVFCAVYDSTVLVKKGQDKKPRSTKQNTDDETSEYSVNHPFQYIKLWRANSSPL